jgi:hypothetical protein
MLKKILKTLSSRALYLVLGLSLAVLIFTAKAAWNDRVTTGQTLTSTLWNDLVAQVESLTNRIGALEISNSSGSGSSSFNQFTTNTDTRSNPGINYWTNNTGKTAFVMFSGSMHGNTENVYLIYINGTQIGQGRSSSYNGSNGGAISFPVPQGATGGLNFTNGGFTGTWYFTYWE